VQLKFGDFSEIEIRRNRALAGIWKWVIARHPGIGGKFRERFSYRTLKKVPIAFSQ